MLVPGWRSRRVQLPAAQLDLAVSRQPEPEPASSVLTALAQRIRRDIEHPAGNDREAIRDEKVRVFKAMRALDPSDVLRGQFRGYREQSGGAVGSSVETFAAVRLASDTWRWAGVPFSLRAGRCLPVTVTEVMVTLNPPLQAIFGEIKLRQSNYLRFRLSPNVLIALGARAKVPGEAMLGEDVELIVRHEAGDEMAPYERLRGDAMRGDASLFPREDSVEEAWRVVDAVLGNLTPVYSYEPNSWVRTRPTCVWPAKAAGTTGGEESRMRAQSCRTLSPTLTPCATTAGSNRTSVHNPAFLSCLRFVLALALLRTAGQMQRPRVSPRCSGPCPCSSGTWRSRANSLSRTRSRRTSARRSYGKH